MNELERDLNDALRDATRQCQRLRYNPTPMIQMMAESGPLGACQRLLDKREVSEGFTRLWELKRLDLTVEAIALRPEFAPLFTDEQLATARERLTKLGHLVPGAFDPLRSNGLPKSEIGPDDAVDRSPAVGAISSKESVGRSSGQGQEVRFAPNLIALTILKQVKERQKDRRETDPSLTQELIREARDGGMYGHGRT
jgi:hypothetical protein